MSVILEGLKRAQQIRMERRQRGKGLGPNLPWFSFWNKRWFTLRRLLCLTGPVLALILFFTAYKPWSNKPLPPVSRTSSSQSDMLSLNQNAHEQLKEEFVGIALEEVKPLPFPEVSVLEEKGEVAGEAGQRQIAVESKENFPKRVARAIPKSAPLATKPVAPVQDRPRDKQMKIQPIPSQEAINHFNLGLLYHKQNKLHNALEEYHRALEADPFDVQAYNNLGMVYTALGRLPEAISQYQKALSINPNYTKAHHNLAVAYYLKGELEKAILEFKTALDSYSKNPEIYNNLGLIYRRQKRGDKAKKVLQAGLSIAPDYPPIHYNLALILENEGDWNGAVFHYRKFVELAPEHQRKLVERVKQHLEAVLIHEKYGKK